MTLNNCKIIGLTGGISTGKSTVSNILVGMGYALIDADKTAREVVEINKPAYLKIVEEFGEDILLVDKSIDRKVLGSIIFNDEKAREKLNNIIHPYIFQAIKDHLLELCKNNLTVFLDIPLLFEEYHLWGKYGIRFHEIWLVYIDKDTQIKRLMKRDNISKEEALKKIGSQMDTNHKKTLSSKIIDNSGDMKCLKEQVDKLLLELV